MGACARPKRSRASRLAAIDEGAQIKSAVLLAKATRLRIVRLRHGTRDSVSSAALQQCQQRPDQT